MTSLKKLGIISTFVGLLLLSGCGTNNEEPKQGTTLSKEEVAQTFTKADKAISRHQYQDANEALTQIEKEADNQSDKKKATQLKEQLKAYNDAYQETLNATNGKESKQAAKALVSVIQKDKETEVAKLAIQTLSRYQKMADLYPGNLSVSYDKMVIAKNDKVKKYEKAETSSKYKKLKKNDSFYAQDICYIEGTPYYALYLDDKKHNNHLKKVGYAKASDFETLQGQKVHKIKVAKKSTDSHIQFLGGDKKIKIKKNQKYYVTYSYKVDGKTIDSINKVDKKGKPVKENGKYYWAGYVDSHYFKYRRLTQ